MRESRCLQDVLDELAPFICRCGKPRVRAVFRLGVAVEQRQPVLKTPQHQGCLSGELIMGATLTATQLVLCSVAFLDRKENPAPVDGKPDWFTDNSDLLALTPSEDGLSCSIAAVGPAGVANVEVRADADLGDGIVPVVARGEVTVTAGVATVGRLVFDTPTEQV